MTAKRCPRMPMPNPVAFNSSPSALAYSALPSANIRILSPTPPDFPQAFITNTSLTAVQAMVSTPFALILSASSTNPGKCLASQVGVNAPATENSTTVLPVKSWSVVIFCGPSPVIRVNVPSGILSPALMVMAFLLSVSLERVGVQRPQFQDSRANARSALECGQGLLGVRDVLQRNLRSAEIDVRLILMLDL